MTRLTRSSAARIRRGITLARSFMPAPTGDRLGREAWTRTMSHQCARINLAPLRMRVGIGGRTVRTLEYPRVALIAQEDTHEGARVLVTSVPLTPRGITLAAPDAPTPGAAIQATHGWGVTP